MILFGASSYGDPQIVCALGGMARQRSHGTPPTLNTYMHQLQQQL